MEITLELSIIATKIIKIWKVIEFFLVAHDFHYSIKILKNEVKALTLYNICYIVYI